MNNKPQWLYWTGAFTDEECDKIVELAKDLESHDATTFGGSGSDGRKTRISWIPDSGEEFSELHTKMRAYCLEANKQWGVSLSNLPPIQFTQYKDVGHKYDWHHDINWSRDDGLHRKISIVVQLSDEDDYEGGDFSFRYIPQPDAEEIRKRGTVLVFLPYHYHMVSEITKGSRNSLVGWFEGPEWK